MSSTPLRDRLEQAGNLKPKPDLAPEDPPLTLDPDPQDEDDVVAAPPVKRGIAVVREIVETVVFVLLVFFIVRGLVQNFRIEGTSMNPTLQDQQYILVNKALYMHVDLNAPLRLLPGKADLPRKIVYPFHSPEHGDVVVFIAPPNATTAENKDYIKRVIGVAGDTVSIIDGKVYVNDVPLDESDYLPEATYTQCRNREPICSETVPPGHIFVMGDNRNNSSDSREWNSLPLENVVGKAWVSYWPRSEWGLIKNPSY